MEQATLRTPFNRSNQLVAGGGFWVAQPGDREESGWLCPLWLLQETLESDSAERSPAQPPSAPLPATLPGVWRCPLFCPSTGAFRRWFSSPRRGSGPPWLQALSSSSCASLCAASASRTLPRALLVQTNRQISRQGKGKGNALPC